jgi:hypothetical protein
MIKWDTESKILKANKQKPDNKPNTNTKNGGKPFQAFLSPALFFETPVLLLQPFLKIFKKRFLKTVRLPFLKSSIRNN